MRYGKIMLPALALSCIGLSACGGGSSDWSSAASDTTTKTNGTAAAAAPATTGGSAQIVVDAGTKLAPISAHQVGTNLGAWFDIKSPGLPQEVASVHPGIIRWPGGSMADQYHWQSHTQCTQDSTGAYTVAGLAYDPNSTFDNFMGTIVTPGGFDAAITVDYCTNAACNGGGDPAEAAAWVSYVKQKGYNAHIHYWTVGNEEFGGWEAGRMTARPTPPRCPAPAVTTHR